jgi:hypothetical protein
VRNFLFSLSCFLAQFLHRLIQPDHKVDDPLIDQFHPLFRSILLNQIPLALAAIPEPASRQSWPRRSIPNPDFRACTGRVPFYIQG